MYHSKLYSLINFLKYNKGEIGTFERFVKSPYFNQKEEVIRLIAYIRRYWHANEQLRRKKMAKEVVYPIIFPGEPFKKWKLNQCTSDLTQLLLKFMAIQEIDQEAERDLLLVAYKKRGMDDHFFKACEKIDVELMERKKTQQFLAPPTYEAIIDNYDRMFFHPSENRYPQKLQADRLAMISPIIDTNYLLKRLIRYCEMAAQNHLNNANYAIPKTADFLAPDSELLDENLLLKAYYNILLLYQTQDVKLVAPTQKLVLQLIQSQGTLNKLKIFELLSNAVPVFPEKGKILHWYFDFYKFAIKNRILIEDNFMTPSHAINIIHLGHVLEKHDFVDSFIGENKQHLTNQQDDGENTLCLFEAYSNYYQKKYNETFRLLNNLKLENAEYGIRQYHLLLMTLLEGRGQIKFKYDFDTKCKSFRVYLRRKARENQLGEASRKGNLHFVRIINQLYHAPYRKINKENLLVGLESAFDIPFNHWLATKIRAL